MKGFVETKCLFLKVQVTLHWQGVNQEDGGYEGREVQIEHDGAAFADDGESAFDHDDRHHLRFGGHHQAEDHRGGFAECFGRF